MENLNEAAPARRRARAGTRRPVTSEFSHARAQILGTRRGEAYRISLISWNSDRRVRVPAASARRKTPDPRRVYFADGFIGGGTRNRSGAPGALDAVQAVSGTGRPCVDVAAREKSCAGAADFSCNESHYHLLWVRRRLNRFTGTTNPKGGACMAASCVTSFCGDRSETAERLAVASHGLIGKASRPRFPDRVVRRQAKPPFYSARQPVRCAPYRCYPCVRCEPPVLRPPDGLAAAPASPPPRSAPRPRRAPTTGLPRGTSPPRGCRTAGSGT